MSFEEAASLRHNSWHFLVIVISEHTIRDPVSGPDGWCRDFVPHVLEVHCGLICDDPVSGECIRLDLVSYRHQIKASHPGPHLGSRWMML